MFASGERAIGAGIFFLGVQVVEAGFYLDGLVSGEERGAENVFEVVDPFDVGYCSAPCNEDVSATEVFDVVFVGDDGDVAHPVGVGAPDGGEGGVLEEVGEVDVGGGVEVAGDGVAGVGHVEVVEEVGGVVLACSAVLGVRVEVEGVVACLCKFAVPDYFSSEVRVHAWLYQALPIVGALDFPPHLAQGSFRI